MSILVVISFLVLPVSILASDHAFLTTGETASSETLSIPEDHAVTWRITTSDDGRVTLYTLRIKNNTNRDLYVTGEIKVQSTKETVHFAKKIKAGKEEPVHDETGKFAVIKVDYITSID